MTDKTTKECGWTFLNSEFWETDCGHAFTLNDGTPAQNGMKFCCYCGDGLVEVVGQNEYV